MSGHPLIVLGLAALLVATLGSFLPTLTKDTSAEAFISPDHPAVVYRDTLEEVFGLSDPVILAVVNEGPNGIFNPRSLNLINFLSRELRRIPGVDPDRVLSIAH